LLCAIRRARGNSPAASWAATSLRPAPTSPTPSWGATTQEVVLGSNRYKVSIGPYVAPAAAGWIGLQVQVQSVGNGGSSVQTPAMIPKVYTPINTCKCTATTADGGGAATGGASGQAGPGALGVNCLPAGGDFATSALRWQTANLLSCPDLTSTLPTGQGVSGPPTPAHELSPLGRGGRARPGAITTTLYVPCPGDLLFRL
jgi:hypothetical protein